MIIAVKKTTENKIYYGVITKVANLTGIPASTIQRWNRNGVELKVKCDYIYYFKTEKL